MKTETLEKCDVQRLPGIVCRGHNFDVPLDYGQESGARISVFAREVVSVGNEDKPDLPWLIFLQGGPGFESPRPEGANGWLKRVLKDFRVLLLDQRGTGLSTPVTHETLAAIGNGAAQADYLKHFRADNIVRDCEAIRNKLAKGAKWTVLGQSYGGFCITTYLSIAPEGLAGVILTGGLPPLVDDPDPVYRATYRQLIENNKLYYKRFPGDAETVRKIIGILRNGEVKLPSGEILSPERFLQLGIKFGFKCGGNSLNSVHYLLERAFVYGSSEKQLSYAFLRSVDNMLDFNSNPIYALLHEAIYCQGRPSNWSAERLIKEFDEFKEGNDLVFFTGEMIYSWMFEQYACLKPLKEAAGLLAEYKDWPPLYDREVLGLNTVPCVATIYYNDLYVARHLAEEAAANIKGIKCWITNEYEHDGLREDGEHILDRLLTMLRDGSN